MIPPYEEQRTIFKTAFITFLGNTLEEFDLQDSDMALACVEVLNEFTDSTLDFTADFDVDDDE
jgi:hypothetical protein|tara:strand:- start:3022 stop:3210 length:189 start_codon:yes stop_codon:yes gene_type:complete